MISKDHPKVNARRTCVESVRLPDAEAERTFYVHSHLKLVSFVTLLSYISSILAFSFLYSSPAYAALPGGGLNSGGTAGSSSSSSSGSTSIDGANDEACDRICEPFQWTDGPKGGNPGLTGSNTWDNKDDVLCQNLGSPTAAGYSTSLPPANAAFTAKNPGCNINMSDDVLKLVKEEASGQPESTYCAIAGKLKDHCHYHNSQLEPQCMAYNSFDDQHTSPRAANQAMIVIDGGVAITCGLACYFVTAPPALHAACGYAATAAGAAELITTLSMKQDNDIGKYAGMIGGMAGMGVGAVGAVEGTKSAMDASKAAKLSSNSPAPDPNAPKAEPERNKLSCATAVIFALMMGVRIYNLIQMDKSKKEACKKIQSLQSSIPAPAATAAATSGNFTPPGTPGGGALSTSGKPGAPSIGDRMAAYTNCTAAASSGTDGACGPDCVSGCMKTANINPQTMNATDGDAVSRSGLTPKALGSIPDPADFLKKATTEGAGSALSSAMPSGMGGVGSGLAAIADAAQRDPSQFDGLLNIGSAYASGGGGGGGGSKGGSDPFAAMFGGGAAGGGGGPAGPGVIQYGAPGAGPDIWHTNSPDNIFQIVSQKIYRVTQRVQ